VPCVAELFPHNIPKLKRNYIIIIIIIIINNNKNYKNNNSSSTDQTLNTFWLQEIKLKIFVLFL